MGRNPNKTVEGDDKWDINVVNERLAKYAVEVKIIKIFVKTVLLSLHLIPINPAFFKK